MPLGFSVAILLKIRNSVFRGFIYIAVSFA